MTAHPAKSSAETATNVKQLFCKSCRAFFDARLFSCPDCGAMRSEPNPHLGAAKINSALYKQAESAVNERKVEAAIRAGHSPEPSKEIKRAAKKIVADL